MLTGAGELELAIENALQEVGQSSEHTLSALARYSIYQAMGTGWESGRGWSRRSLLAIYSATKVLPLWTEKYPGEDLPNRAMRLAHQGYNGEVSRAEACLSKARLWGELESLPIAQTADPIIVAAYTTLYALATVCRDEAFLFYYTQASDVIGDGARESSEHDTAFSASVAYAFGTPWSSRSDPARREEFWHWWLEIAVPQAWSLDTLPAT